MIPSIDGVATQRAAADGVETIVAVVGGDDVSRWLELALHSYDRHAAFIRNIVVVTNDAPGVRRVLASCEYGTRVTAVLTDDWLLSMRERALGGWQRQQLVKLRAWTLTSDRYFVAADVDALLIRPVALADLLEAGHADSSAVLYHHLFPGKSQSHLEFEQRRIEALGALFDVPLFDERVNHVLVGDVANPLIVYYARLFQQLQCHRPAVPNDEDFFLIHYAASN